MKYLRLALAALLVAAGIGWLVQASPVDAASSNTNDAAYWEEWADHDAQCYKHDPPGNGGGHGYLTDGGKAVMLNPFDPSWPGDHWELLVVKSGSNDIGYGAGNKVYVHPEAGVAYYGPVNSGGSIGNVSHWIVCKGTAPDQPADKVEYSNWKDEAWVCGATSVTQTRTKTTIPYKFVSGEWVLDPSGKVVETEVTTRPLTDEEIQSCKPDDKVEYTDWQDQSWVCGDTSVTQTRTKTVTPYVLVNGQWVPGQSTVTTETQTRPLTDAEIQSCQPDQKVEYSEWVDGTWKCGDTSVTQTRTKTVTTYVLVDNQWVPGEPVVTEETQARPLTGDEIQSCKPADKVEQSPWVDGTWKCGDTSVTQTRTKTVTTYVLVDDQWVPGEPVVTQETQTRPLTDAEIQSCKPADKVVETPWTDGEWDCGDTTVTQTRTVTVTPYVLVDGQWVPGTPSVDHQSKVRQLTEDEQFDCVEPRIDVAAFSPVCQADIPYIQYAIEVSGTPNTTATITFLDNKGVEVARYENQPFTGKLIYPGASADPADWPGWKYENGNWNLDPTDAHLREGLTVKVEVNPTATADVTYPPAGAPCDGPTIVASQAPTTTAAPAQQDPAPTTTVAPVTQLPSTGSNSTGMIALIGLLLLGAGGAIVALVRRPRRA